MTPRNTNTGGVLEAMILPALDRGGYTYRKQSETGTRPGGVTVSRAEMKASALASLLRDELPSSRSHVHEHVRIEREFHT